MRNGLFCKETEERANRQYSKLAHCHSRKRRYDQPVSSDKYKVWHLCCFHFYFVSSYFYLKLQKFYNTTTRTHHVNEQLIFVTGQLTTSLFVRIVSTVIVMIASPVTRDALAIGTLEFSWATCAGYKGTQKQIQRSIYK